MKTFEGWLQNRSISEKIDKLCEAIAFSGISYELFWQETAEPLLVKSMYSSDITESKLLQQLQETTPWAGDPDAYGAGHDYIFNPPAAVKRQRTNELKKQQSATFAANNEKVINQIKAKLINSLEDFKRNIIQSTQDKNPELAHDHPLHQKFFMIVSSLISNMQKQAQNWKPQAVIGKNAPDWQAKHQGFLGQQRSMMPHRAQPTV